MGCPAHKCSSKMQQTLAASIHLVWRLPALWPKLSRFSKDLIQILNLFESKCVSEQKLSLIRRSLIWWCHHWRLGSFCMSRWFQLTSWRWSEPKGPLRYRQGLDHPLCSIDRFHSQWFSNISQSSHFQRYLKALPQRSDIFELLLGAKLQDWIWWTLKFG